MKWRLIWNRKSVFISKSTHNGFSRKFAHSKNSLRFPGMRVIKKLFQARISIKGEINKSLKEVIRKVEKPKNEEGDDDEEDEDHRKSLAKCVFKVFAIIGYMERMLMTGDGLRKHLSKAYGSKREEHKQQQHRLQKGYG